MQFKDLSLAQRVALLCLAVVVVVLVPEMPIFMDVGGLELVATLLLTNLAALRATTSQKFNYSRERLSAFASQLTAAIRCTQLSRPDVFVSQTVTRAVFVLTSSLALSGLSLLTPAMLIVT